MPINFHSSDNKYTYTNRQATDSWTHRIQNIIDIKEKRVIDIGCGGGIYTKQLGLMGASEVIGVDFSNQMLQAAKENCAHISNISFIQGDAYNIPFAIEDLLQDLSPRTGRSILHELSDNELSHLLQHIHSKLYEKSPIIEQDRWTIWTAVKE